MDQQTELSRETPEWAYAEQIYNRFLHSLPTFSIMGIGFNDKHYASIEQRNHALEKIFQVCPSYYPALFHKGELLLRIGKTEEGEKFIEDAFNYATQILSHEEKDEEYIITIAQQTENLGKLLRYDLAAKYMEKAITIYPEAAALYDFLAFYLLQDPEQDKNRILDLQQKAQDLDPTNDFFVNNLGWIYMMMGRYEEAEKCFNEVSFDNLDRDEAEENLEIARYMEEHEMTYLQYLLRPADQKYLDQLQEDESYETMSELCELYNNDKLDAFKIYHSGKKKLQPHRILDVYHPINAFLKLVGNQLENSEMFLLEDLDILIEKLQEFISQYFLPDSEVADPVLFDTLFDALPVFYDFLKEQNIITPKQYDEIAEQFTLLKDIIHIPPAPETSMETVDKGLEMLISTNTEYYPVLIFWGTYLLRTGQESEGEKLFDQGFDAISEIYTEEEDDGFLVIELTKFIKTLHDLLHDDLATGYMEEAVERFPGIPALNGYLASCLLRSSTPDYHSILETNQIALDDEPRNSIFLVTHGWVNMMLGNYDEAEEYFEEALRNDHENQVTDDNLFILDYLREKSGTYFDYLISPPDTEYLQELIEEANAATSSDKIDEALAHCFKNNTDKLKAFKLHHLKLNDIPIPRILDTVETLNVFLEILEDSIERETLEKVEDVFFFENTNRLLDRIKYYCFLFIDNGGPSGELVEYDIFEALKAIYEFLYEMKCISTDQHKQIITKIEETGQEFPIHIPHYIDVLNDFSLSHEEQQEKIRAIFGF